MLGKKPRIAIITGFQEPLSVQAKAKLENYIQAIKKSGGLPFLISAHEDIQPHELLSKMDGLLLTGGGDIPAHFWGEKDVKDPTPSEENRARFELPLIQKAHKKDIPIFGICLGMQAINVAMGGSLHLDLTDPQSSKLHCRKQDGSSSSHAITIASDSKLSKIFPSEIEVNSRHHQAVKNLANGFKISAQAKDNVVEAIESLNSKWILGVQWHPEDLFESSLLQQKLFETFIHACL